MAAELALYYAGRSDLDRVARTLDLFMANRKPFPLQGGTKEGLQQMVASVGGQDSLHGGPHQWASYYYFFGTYWASRAMTHLAGRPDMPGYAKTLAEEVLSIGESAFGETQFADSPGMAGKNYGTSAAILTLVHLRDVLR